MVQNGNKMDSVDEIFVCVVGIQLTCLFQKSTIETLKFKIPVESLLGRRMNGP